MAHAREPTNADVITDTGGDDHLRLPAQHKAVTSTVCLNWDKGDTHATIPIHRAHKYLIAGYKNVQTEGMTHTPLDFKIKPSKWASLLDDLADKGAFEVGYTDGNTLIAALCVIQPLLEPGNQTLTGDDLIAPATTSAPRSGRRNNTTPAEGEGDATEPTLGFLLKTSIAGLVGEGERPMRHLCHLLGMLGSTSATRRAEPGSGVRVVASLVRHYVSTFLKQPTNASDEVLSAYLRQFLASTEPNEALQSGRTDDITLRNEGIDGIRRVP